MTLSTEDREWVKLAARELVHEVTLELLKTHIEACPHGQLIGRFKSLAVGIVVGLVLAAGSVGYGLARIGLAM